MNEEKVRILKQQAYQKFKSSESMQFLKEVANELTTEEFLKFSDVAMLDAYRKNRTKAVGYMLSFYPKDEPPLLLKIHLSTMLSQTQELEKNKKDMLEVILSNFSSSFFHECLDNYMSQVSQKENVRFENRKIEILDIMLEQSLNNKKDNITVRNKI